MIDEVTDRLRVVFGSVERHGAWNVPPQFDLRVLWGHAQLDLREATLGPGVTTFVVNVTMGNLELIVPDDLEVELAVQSVGGNVEDVRRTALGAAAIADRPVPYRSSADHSVRRVLRLVGRVKMGNCEVIALQPGETREDLAHHQRDAHRARRHKWRELHRMRRDAHRMGRDAWHLEHHGWRERSWLWPKWFQARIQRRIFSWLTLALIAGVFLGTRIDGTPRWWQIGIAAIVLSMVSGMVAWRLTRPLIVTIKAATEIGEGKLDVRVDTRRGGRELRVLGGAINDMAAKIRQQLADQRQLLAAVSHELRTPLGHMRVLIETARETKDQAALAELDREVVVLDDLVGKLLASSRLEFGNLERRTTDLGELVADVATSAGVATDAIEAIGDVTVPVDPTLVRRAVANLIDNARTHGRGAIAVRAERRGNQVLIEVDDAGPGVAADRRADAFRAFVPSSGGGLGLGLALVSRIAVAHGGGAWIKDRPGGGARVGFAVATAA